MTSASNKIAPALSRDGSQTSSGFWENVSSVDLEDCITLPGDPLGDSVGGINISSDLHADDAEFESYGFGDIDFALFDPDPPLQDELASQRRLAEVLDHESSGVSEPPDSTQQSVSDGASRKRKASELSIGSEGSDKRAKIKAYDFPPILIAHHPEVNKLVDKLKVPEGIRWEIARLISSGKLDYSMITEKKLSLLCSNNTQAPHIMKILKPGTSENENDGFQGAYAKELEAKWPWNDLDKEASATLEERLGIADDSARSGCYGNTHFIAKIKRTKGNSAGFNFEMLPPEKGPSDRLRRRWGSPSFMRITFDGPMNDTMRKYILRPISILGRIYRVFRRKDEHLHLFRTNESINDDGTISEAPIESDDGLLSLENFIHRINSPVINHEQPVAKWASRIDILLSNSVPLGALIEEVDITMISDIISPAFRGKGKPPAFMDMSDGCGFANIAALALAAKYHRSGTVPTAIQMRFGGAKGLLLRHPDPLENANTKPRIRLRPSQIKILYDSSAASAPENRIIDLIRTSNMKVGCSISSQTLINLAENGVPIDVFTNMVSNNLDEIVKWFTDLDGPDSMLALRDRIAREGGIVFARRAREIVGEARARGFRSFEYEKKTDDEIADIEGLAHLDTEIEDKEQSSAWWRDPISGLPSSLEETAIEFIDCGFMPQDTPILAEKIKQVAKTYITKRNKPPKYSITIPMSCSGFVVPDPCGVLKEGEIFIRSSRPLKIVVNGVEHNSDIVVGPVLVTRYPCVLPTDVQKVEAVDKPELHEYTDVIIFSTDGSRSQASKEGGGDYDGDIDIVIWDPRIVTPFHNASHKYLNEPHGLPHHFDSAIQRVSELMDQCHRMVSVFERTETLQTALVAINYDQSLVGLYSHLHNIATYKLGYGHDTTWRLAYMFCTILDGAKSGRIVRTTSKAHDCKNLGTRVPSWMEKARKSKMDTDNTLPPNKQKGGPFIMDVIRNHMEKETNRALDSVTAVYDILVRRSRIDPVLEGPFKEAEDLVKCRLEEHGNTIGMRELAVIKHYVEECHADARSKTRGNFTSLPIERRQDTLRRLSERFTVATFLKRLAAQQVALKDDSKPPIRKITQFSKNELSRIMASYLYFFDYKSEGKHTRSPWDMAFARLCSIKANDNGEGRMIQNAFYEKMTIHRAYRPIT